MCVTSVSRVWGRSRSSEHEMNRASAPKARASAMWRCFTLCMSDQKSMNRQTWESLRSAGFVEGSALDVEVFFIAPGDAEAHAVTDALLNRGWEAQTTSMSQGLFRKRIIWGAVGNKSVGVSSIDDLDVLVDEMGTIAAGNGAEFDGWGAQVAG